MIQRILAFMLVIALLVSMAAMALAPTIGRQDLVAYWSAAHLLAHGQSPYDPATMEVAQRAACPDCLGTGPALRAWNPPWLMVLLLPLGLLSFDLAVPAWMFSSMAILGISIVLTWTLLPEAETIGANAERGLLAALLAGFMFGPTLILFEFGQIGGLLILSLVAGVWLIRADCPRLAGMVLLLATIKPHMTYVPLMIVGLWILRTRQWRVLQGGILAIAASIAVVSSLYPRWASDYLALMGQFHFTQINTSTLSSFVQQRLGLRGLQFAGLFILPLVVPLSTRFATAPMSTLNLALVLAIPVAAYGFSFDHVVLVPALVQVVAWLFARGRVDPASALIVGALVAIDVGVAVQQAQGELTADLLFWPPIAVLAIYGATWKLAANE